MASLDVTKGVERKTLWGDLRHFSLPTLFVGWSKFTWQFAPLLSDSLRHFCQRKYSISFRWKLVCRSLFLECFYSMSFWFHVTHPAQGREAEFPWKANKHFNKRLMFSLFSSLKAKIAIFIVQCLPLKIYLQFLQNSRNIFFILKAGNGESGHSVYNYV